MQWITDRVPQNSELQMTIKTHDRTLYEGQFIVTCEQKHVTVVRFFKSYNNEFKEWSKGYWAIDKKVIAWMALPEPYSP